MLQIQINFGNPSSFIIHKISPPARCFLLAKYFQRILEQRFCAVPVPDSYKKLKCIDKAISEERNL